MKRFLQGSIGILMLAVAFHLGATTADTCYVDQACHGVVAHSHCRTSGVIALDEDGTMWRIDPSQGWGHSDLPPLPVPVTSVKFIAAAGRGCSVVTIDNQVWIHDGHGGWDDCGVWPGGDSPVERTSWGGLKAQYADQSR